MTGEMAFFSSLLHWDGNDKTTSPKKMLSPELDPRMTFNLTLHKLFVFMLSVVDACEKISKHLIGCF